MKNIFLIGMMGSWKSTVGRKLADHLQMQFVDTDDAIEEITEIISWYNLNLHSKPIILLNYNKFWDPLIQMYKKTYNQKFNNKKCKNIFYSVNSIKEIKEII